MRIKTLQRRENSKQEPEQRVKVITPFNNKVHPFCGCFKTILCLVKVSLSLSVSTQALEPLTRKRKKKKKSHNRIHNLWIKDYGTFPSFISALMKPLKQIVKFKSDVTSVSDKKEIH